MKHQHPRALAFIVTLCALASACGPLRYPDLVDASADAEADGGAPPPDGDTGFALDAEPPDLGSATERDATTPEADADVGLGAPDAEPPVTVVIRRGGVPVAGVDVVFHAGDGRVVSSTVTGATGRAVGAAPAGGMVSVVEISGTSDIGAGVQTMVDVSPGDVLEYEAAETHTFANVLAYLPEPYPGAAEYRLSIDCGAGSSSPSFGPLSATVPRGCFAQNRTFELLATARDADGVALAYSTTTILLTITSTTEATLPSWSTTFGELAVDVANVPADALELIAESTPIYAERVLAAGRSTASLPVPSSAARLLLKTIPSASDSTALNVRWRSTSSPDLSFAATLPLARTATVAFVDVAATSIPRIELNGIDDTVPSRPRYSWQIQPRTAFGDFGALLTGFTGPGHSMLWAVYFPATRQEVRLPALPAALAARLPATPFPSPSILLLADADAVMGYSAARPNLFGLFFSDTSKGNGGGRTVAYGLRF